MNKVGRFGEDIACRFLVKRGYKIIDRNYSKKWGELDIVAKKDRKVFFVEVKTISCRFEDRPVKIVTHVTEYRPEENMSRSKILKFIRITQTYLQEKHLEKSEWSMSFVAVRVDLAKKKAKVRFIEDLVF